MKYLIIPALTAIAFHFAFDDALLKDIQTGKKLLICNGKHIAPEMVTGFSDGIWWFRNGYAKNCEVKQ